MCEERFDEVEAFRRTLMGLVKCSQPAETNHRWVSLVSTMSWPRGGRQDQVPESKSENQSMILP